MFPRRGSFAFLPPCYYLQQVFAAGIVAWRFEEKRFAFWRIMKMADVKKTYQQLCAHVRETAMVESIQAVLGWDERTYMPPQAGEYRAEQLTWLAATSHQRRTMPQLGEWLDICEDSDLVEDVHGETATVIRQLRRDYQKRVKLPQSLVEELVRATVLGQQAWVQARQADDFASFVPVLTTIIDLKRQQAEAIGYEESPYDALLDDYEPGETTANVERVLSSLREDLVPLVAAIAESGRQPAVEVLSRDYPVAQQEQLGKQVAARLGFDFRRGRLDVTHHPFCSGMGPFDCRITTRYDENFFPMAFFGILHEAGHGIYDQGLRTDFYGLPPGEFISLGIHESQSRLWENQVGRSRAFWQHMFPALQQTFTTALQDVTLDQFYFAINEIRPSLIRVEADEATYNLHIIIRFELEQALIQGDLQVVDLPSAWRDKYREFLGIEPPNDADGVLQDIHWSAGLIGYFPTYSLGNLYAAQFYARAEEELGDLETLVAEGQFAPLKDWLQEKIHQPGQCFGANELVERVTGQQLSHQPLLTYLRAKLEPLYGIG